MPLPKKSAAKPVKEEVAKEVTTAKRVAEPAIDFEADKKSATPEDLAAISKMADRHAELQLLVREEQEYMKTLTDEIYRLESVSLPEAMAACGMESFKTTSGAAVAIIPFMECSLPAAGSIEKAKGDEKAELEQRFQDGLKWIIEHDGEPIIKSVVMVNFEKGQAETKKKLVDALVEKGYMAASLDAVHPQTLKSWLKEKISKGVDVPFDTFKIYSGTKAEVKLPKTK